MCIVCAVNISTTLRCASLALRCVMFTQRSSHIISSLFFIYSRGWRVCAILLLKLLSLLLAISFACELQISLKIFRCSQFAACGFAQMNSRSCSRSSFVARVARTFHIAPLKIDGIFSASQLMRSERAHPFLTLLILTHDRNSGARACAEKREKNQKFQSSRALRVCVNVAPIAS